MSPTHNRFFNDAAGNHSSAVLQTMGPLLAVNVHQPKALVQLLSSSGQPVASPVGGLALIDTGATNTCVDGAVLQKLGMAPIGVLTSLTAAGPAPQSMYPVRLEFPSEGLDLEFSSVAGVNLTGQSVPVVPPGGQQGQQMPIIALVGRDVLSRCVLIYNGTGGFFTLSF
jgi:hypothetical protein